MKIYIRFLIITCISFACSIQVASCSKQEPEKGLIIAAYGLSGSGKSSTFRELNKITNTILIDEPEQPLWPSHIADPKFTDRFTHIMSFRSLRAAQIYKADKLRSEGKLVLLEPYYIKVTSYYLGREFLQDYISPEDPYFDLALEISKKDADLLPEADVVVLFDTDYNTWKHFLNSRGRPYDKYDKHIKSFPSAKYADDIAKRLQEKGIKIIRMQQNFSSPKKRALELKEKLINEGILASEG